MHTTALYFLERENLEKDNELEKLKKEIDSKSSRIQNLEKLIQDQWAKLATKKSDAETQKDNELEKLKREIDSKSSQIQNLEKLIQDQWAKLATKKIDAETQKKQYDTIINDLKINLHGTEEHLNEISGKYELQKEQRELYETQNSKIMHILNINDLNYMNILPAIQNLKKSVEKNEENFNEIIAKYKLQKEQRELYETQNFKIMQLLKIKEDHNNYMKIFPAIEKLKNSVEKTEENFYTNSMQNLP